MAVGFERLWEQRDYGGVQIAILSYMLLVTLSLDFLVYSVQTLGHYTPISESWNQLTGLWPTFKKNEYIRLYCVYQGSVLFYKALFQSYMHATLGCKIYESQSEKFEMYFSRLWTLVELGLYLIQIKHMEVKNWRRLLVTSGLDILCHRDSPLNLLQWENHA